MKVGPAPCFERIASGCSKCSPVGSFSDGCTNGGLREGMLSLQQVPGCERNIPVEQFRTKKV